MRGSVCTFNYGPRASSYRLDFEIRYNLCIFIGMQTCIYKITKCGFTMTFIFKGEESRLA